MYCLYFWMKLLMSIFRFCGFFREPNTNLLDLNLFARFLISFMDCFRRFIFWESISNFFVGLWVCNSSFIFYMAYPFWVRILIFICFYYFFLGTFLGFFGQLIHRYFIKEGENDRLCFPFSDFFKRRGTINSESETFFMEL